MTEKVIIYRQLNIFENPKSHLTGGGIVMSEFAREAADLGLKQELLVNTTGTYLEMAAHPFPPGTSLYKPPDLISLPLTPDATSGKEQTHGHNFAQRPSPL